MKSYKEKIIKALMTLKDRKGSSRQAISNYIDANYKGECKSQYFKKSLNDLLKQGVVRKAENSHNRFFLSKKGKAQVSKNKTTATPTKSKPKPIKKLTRTKGKLPQRRQTKTSNTDNKQKKKSDNNDNNNNNDKNDE